MKMACNSAQPRDQIYVKRYIFLPFARNIKKIYISGNLKQ